MPMKLIRKISTTVNFCFLSDANGVRNRYTGHFEKVFDHNQKTYRFIIKGNR